VQVLGGQSGRGVCPMTPCAHWFHVNTTHLISLTKGGLSQPSTWVPSKLAPCLQSRDSPWNPWDVKVPRVYKCQGDVGESKSREYGWPEERVESGSVNLDLRIVIKTSREGWLPGTQREVPRRRLSIQCRKHHRDATWRDASWLLAFARHYQF
jgi:hypothetical protein